MSLHDCLQRAIDGGDLPKGLARAAQKLYAERLQARAGAGQGAEALAAEDVWVFLRRENIRKRRGAYMQASAQMSIADALARHRDSDGNPNAASAMRQLIEWGQSATFQSVSGVRQALEASYLRDIGQLVETHKRNILGNVRQKAGLKNIVRELMGEGTGDPHAFAIAQAAKDTIERARREFNAQGGEIGKLEGYGLPHAWDRKLVAAAPASDWAAEMYDQMDWARIIDRATEQPFEQSSKAARIAFLEKVHGTITTGGWATREPSGVSIGASLGKSRSDARVLHFKTADGWLAMNDKYGAADPFTTIIEHLKGMARDTAMMRILGPNPQAGLEYARQVAMKLATDRPWTPAKPLSINGVGIPMYHTPQEEVTGIYAQTQTMLNMVSGTHAPEMTVVAGVISNNLKPWLISSQLAGATLSAFSDVGFMEAAAHHVGIAPLKMVRRQLAAVTESLTDTAISLATMGHVQRDRVAARFARLGIIAEGAASTGVAQARYFGETFSPGIMHRISEATLRVSGLTAWTDHARGVFLSETYGLLAENALFKWHEIDAPLRDLVFIPRGITPEDWEIIRTTELYWTPDAPGATFLIPDDIRRRTDIDPETALDLSLKLGSAIREQMEFAVPTSSLRARAALQSARPGSAGGVLIDSALMYKNYPMSIMYNQIGRINHHKVRGTRFSAIAQFALATTIGGAVTIQLKEMLPKANDPRPMNERQFWMAAMIQGGGMGIFGDFLYSSTNRFGGGFAGTVAGPLISTVSDTGSLLTSGAEAIMSGDAGKIDTFQRNLIKFADRFGGPTNLWYLNAAWQRNIWDNLQLWADGDAAEAFARTEKQHRKDYGSGTFWPRAQPLPSRLPDFSHAFGATP